MQRYELEAWLGDDHQLTNEQIDELHGLADEIEARYPDPDDQDERDAALTTAHQLLLAQDDVLGALAEDLVVARTAEARALASIQQAAHMLIPAKTSTEAGFARQTGIDRQAVRKWLGKK